MPNLNVHVKWEQRSVLPYLNSSVSCDGVAWTFILIVHVDRGQRSVLPYLYSSVSCDGDLCFRGNGTWFTFVSVVWFVLLFFIFRRAFGSNSDVRYVFWSSTHWCLFGFCIVIRLVVSFALNSIILNSTWFSHVHCKCHCYLYQCSFIHLFF